MSHLGLCLLGVTKDFISHAHGLYLSTLTQAMTAEPRHHLQMVVSNYFPIRVIRTSLLLLGDSLYSIRSVRMVAQHPFQHLVKLLQARARQIEYICAFKLADLVGHMSMQKVHVCSRSCLLEPSNPPRTYKMR